jgi:hypothetical protein
MINIPYIKKCLQIEALGFIEVYVQSWQFPVQVSVTDKMDKVQFQHHTKYVLHWSG